jgi:hypothetical protein
MHHNWFTRHGVAQCLWNFGQHLNRTIALGGYTYMSWMEQAMGHGPASVLSSEEMDLQLLTAVDNSWGSWLFPWPPLAPGL